MIQLSPESATLQEIVFARTNTTNEVQKIFSFFSDYEMCRCLSVQTAAFVPRVSQDRVAIDSGIDQLTLSVAHKEVRSSLTPV